MKNSLFHSDKRQVNISILVDIPIDIHDTIWSVQNTVNLLYNSLDQHNLHHHMATIRVMFDTYKTILVDNVFYILHEHFLFE